MKRYIEFINEKVDLDEKLIYFAIRNNLKGVKKALDNGADIHDLNDGALRWASANGHLEIVKYLVEQGANIHALNNNAFRMACDYGHLEVVKYLVEKGANIHDLGDDALQFASKNDHLDIVNYLCEYIIQKEPSYIPKIMEYIPDELKEKYPYLMAGADMDLL